MNGGSEADGFPPGEELDLGLPPRHISAEPDEVTVSRSDVDAVLKLAAGNAALDPGPFNRLAKAIGVLR